MRLNEIITKIHESENHLIICEEKMNELLDSINLVLNEELKNDILSVIGLLTKYIEIVFLSNDKILTTKFSKKILEKDLDLFNEINKYDDEEYLKQKKEELINFIKLINKYDNKLYEDILIYLLHIFFLKGYLLIDEYEFIISLIEGVEIRIGEYDNKWSKIYQPSILEKINKITSNKENILKHLKIVNNILIEIIDPKQCDCLLIPNTVIGFSEKVFKGNKYLRAVKFEEEFVLNKIPKKLFEECENLEYIDFSNTDILEIDEKCFFNCHNLKMIKGIEQIEKIEDEVFIGCEGLLWDYDKNESSYTETGLYILNQRKIIEKITSHNKENVKYITILEINKNRSLSKLYEIKQTSKVNLGDEVNIISSDINSKCIVSKIYEGPRPKPTGYASIPNQEYKDKEIQVVKKCTKENINFILKEMSGYFSDKIITPQQWDKSSFDEKRKSYNYTTDEYNNFLSLGKENRETRYQKMKQYAKNSTFDDIDYEKAKKEFYECAIIKNNALIKLTKYLEVLYIPKEIIALRKNALNNCIYTRRIIFEHRESKMYCDEFNYVYLLNTCCIDLSNFEIDYQFFKRKVPYLFEIKIAADNPKYAVHNYGVYSKNYYELHKILSSQNEGYSFHIHPNTFVITSFCYENSNVGKIYLNNFVDEYRIRGAYPTGAKIPFSIIEKDNISVSNEYEYVFNTMQLIKVGPVDCELNTNSYPSVFAYGSLVNKDDIITIKNDETTLDLIVKEAKVCNKKSHIAEDIRSNYKIVVDILKLKRKDKNKKYVEIDISNCKHVPIVLDDDYPFNYDKDMIYQINQARLGNVAYIKELINYYKNKNVIKYEYWNNILNNKEGVNL